MQIGERIKSTYKPMMGTITHVGTRHAWVKWDDTTVQLVAISKPARRV